MKTYSEKLSRLFEEMDSDEFNDYWNKATDLDLIEYDDLISDMGEQKCRAVYEMITNRTGHTYEEIA